MAILFKFALSVGAAMSLVACSTTTASVNHIDAGARPFIKKIDSVLVAQQNQIGADVKESSGLSNILGVVQGTPIPILIDAGLTSIRVVRANNTAKPVREKLEEFDFPEEFKKRMEASMTGSKLDNVENMRLIRTAWPDFRLRFIEFSEADAVLFVDMRYSFTPQFDSLYVAAHAIMFPNTPELRPFQEKPDKDNVIEMSDNIYRNQFAAVIAAQNTDGSREQNAAFWNSLSEEEITGILQAAAIRLADTLADDMSIDDAATISAESETPKDIEVAAEDIAAVQTDEAVALEETNSPERNAAPEEVAVETEVETETTS